VIDQLDRTLRRLFRDRIPALGTDLQVRFEPPNDDWRMYVGNLPAGAVALNIYLVDLREDRELRSTERFREATNGFEFEEQAPARVDCHYLLSAWDQANPTPAIQPTLDEHALLYSALSVLLNNMPINPSRILPAAQLAAIDPLIRDSDLPTKVVPAEGFAKLPEFWGRMGQVPWRPAIYLIVTLPVAFGSEFVGQIVTTLIEEYRLDGGPAEDVWIQIGGTVVDNAAAPVAEAWVGLETAAGVRVQTTRTNELGRFTFIGLSPDSYRLRYRASGRPEQVRVVTVPEPSGDYDLQFP
jgi:Pvc16 N-terminal domain/Carboxypeptidase regulatory-like domain